MDILRTKYKKQCLSYLRNEKSKGLYAREFKFSKLLGKVIIQNQILTIWGKKGQINAFITIFVSAYLRGLISELLCSKNRG